MTSTTQLKKDWIICPKPNPKTRLRLFCFPCAGGMVSTYTRWAAGFPEDVELCVIHLPGRGKRIAETPFEHIDPLLPVLSQSLEAYLDIPFAFIGHSMGAVLCFEVARYLRRHNQPQPQHLFCCSCPAPQTPIATPHIHTLPETTFIAELNRRYAAIPETIRKDPDVLQLFLPSLRADFSLLETYQYLQDVPLNCPISAYAGLQDRAVSAADLADWCDHTRDRFELKMFMGDHFFVHSHSQSFLQTLIQKVKLIA